MKNVYKILFTIVCVFASIGLIMAGDSGVGTGSGETVGGGSNSCTGSVCSPNSNGSSGNYLYGIRISFYKSDGTRISSKDYLANNVVHRPTYTIYGGGMPCSKISRCTGSWQPASIASATELTNIFNQSGININIDSVIKNRSLSKQILFSQILAEGGKDIGKTLFTNFGINYQQYYTANDSYDLFLIWEPLGSVTYDGKAYIGTAQELLNFLKSVPGNNFGSNGNLTAYQYVGNNLTRGMGCAVNLDDGDQFGNSVNAKFPGNFSARSYFRGKLEASSAGTVHSLCNNSSSRASHYESYATGEGGYTSSFAIGILWFDEIGGGTPGLSCTDVKNFYNDTGNTICSKIKMTGNFDFSAFNAANAGKIFPQGAQGGITTEWFKNNCCFSSDFGEGGINCTPQYNVPSCTSGNNQTLTYSDSANWQHCIFTDENEINGVKIKNNYTITPHKWANPTETLSYYDANLSSKYCQVYCREEVYGNFDSSNPSVLAGNHFIWGWSTVTSKRTCATKSIDFEQFAKDLANANQAVANELAKNRLKKENDGKTWSFVQDNYTGLHGDYQCTTKYDHNAGAHIQDCVYPGCSHDAGSCDGNRPVENCTYTFTCNGTYVNSTYKHNTDTYAEVYVGGIKGTASTTVHTTTANKNNPPTHNPVGGGNVQAAVNTVNSVIAEMKKCYDFADDNILNDQSKATISYISPNNTYDYSGDMKKSTGYSTNEAACTEAKQYIILNNCNENGCSNVTQNMYNCASHTGERTSTTTFSLNAGVYQFVVKNPNNLTLKSVHSSEIGTYQTSTSPKYNWTDIGYSNFPVPFNSEGEHSGSLQIKYSNIGHKDSTDTTTDIDKILSGTPSYGNYGNWSCGYTVENDLIPGPDGGSDGGNGGDINVIYREIDLYTPFPDTNSKGRHTGANWCGTDNCNPDATNDTVNKYILQNRSVTGDDVYRLEPMYTFIMTPSDIIRIRRYNDKNTYSSYDGSLDGKKYKFECTSGSLRNCRSDYLSQLIKDLDAENLVGSCKNDRQVYQTNDANAKFESCRYLKK